MRNTRGHRHSGARATPASQLGEASDDAQPGTNPSCDARRFGRRDLAACNGRQNSGQDLPEILDRAQR